METTEDAFLGGKLVIAQACMVRAPGSMRCFSRRPALRKPGETVLDAGRGQRRRGARDRAPVCRGVRSQAWKSIRTLRIGEPECGAQWPCRRAAFHLRRCDRAAQPAFRLGAGARQFRPCRRQSAVPGRRRGRGSRPRRCCAAPMRWSRATWKDGSNASPHS